MGFRDLFRRRGPAETAARARLERAQTERWPLRDDQLDTLSGAVDAARRYDRRPELGRSYTQQSAEAIERDIDARQVAVQERLQGIEAGFSELRTQDPFGGQEKYGFLPEPDWDGGRPSVADLEGWADTHEKMLARDSVELRHQLNAERLEFDRQQAINDAAFQRQVAEDFAGELEAWEQQGPTERQWRALCATVYDAHIQQIAIRWGATVAQANRLEATLSTIRDQALELAPHVDIPPSVLAQEALEAAQLHGRDPGSDYDPDRFAEPDWDWMRRERVGPDLAGLGASSAAGAAPQPALELGEQETADRQADRTGPEADADAPTAPSGDEVRAQAEALRQAYFREMTRENTPAAFVDDRYTYEDDVWLSDARHSDELERQLREHVRANPAEFVDTKFENYLHDLDPAPAPRAAGHRDPAESLEPATLEAADEQLVEPDQSERDQRECGDDEFDAPF